METMKLTPAELAVLERDYARGEVDRAEAARYSRIHRGSVRLAMDLFRTEEEQRHIVDEALRLHLPGQK